MSDPTIVRCGMPLLFVMMINLAIKEGLITEEDGKVLLDQVARSIKSTEESH